MKSIIEIDINSKEPLYKQLISNIEYLIDSGMYKKGDYVPSLNDLSHELQISRETVKKAYVILRNMGLLDSTQGKGYYISKNKHGKIRILLLLDKLSSYKQVTFDSFSKVLGNTSEISIKLHNQEIELFENFLNNELDKYDHYVITPHFPLDKVTQQRALLALKRIPNRKLLLLDRNMENLTGSFSAVYQDYGQDIFEGLLQGKKELERFKKLNIISMPSSLYAPFLKIGVKKFCEQHGLNYELHSEISLNKLQKNEVYLILNSHLDDELIDLIRASKQKGYKIGKDIGIIAYNESPINEIILDGLTVFSTDFEQMGKLAGEIILNKTINKIKCDFKLIRRGTF